MSKVTPPIRRRRDAGTRGRDGCGGNSLHVPALPRVLVVAKGGAPPPPWGLAARVIHRGIAVEGGGGAGCKRRIGGVLRVAQRMTTDDVVPGAASYPVNTTNSVLLGATGGNVVPGATAVTRKTVSRVSACTAAANVFSLRGGQAQR